MKPYFLYLVGYACCFPSAGTENSVQLDLFSVPVDGK